MNQLKEYVKNKKEVEIVSEVRKRYVKDYVDFLIKKGNLGRNKILVDVPCGTGDMAKEIFERTNTEKIVLIDINENMIKFAKERLKNGIQTIIGDAGKIGNLINFKVDTIVCLNGFHQYINRKFNFLKGCKKILKENGRLIFDISTRGLHDKYTRDFFKTQEKEASKSSTKLSVKTYFPRWSNEEILEKYRRMIKKSGLQLIEEKEFTSYKTTSEILVGLTEIPGRSRPWIPNLNYNQRKKILEESVKKAIEKLGQKKIEHNRVFFISENSV